MAHTATPRADGGLATRSGVVAALGVAVTVTDLDGVIEGWNGAAEELYGWSAEDAQGRDMAELLPARPAAAPEPPGGTGGGPWRGSGEYLVATRWGRDVRVQVTTTPVVDPAGEVVGAVSVSVDLTGTARADAESRYRGHFSASLVPQVITTPEGIVEAVNPAFCELLGRSEEEMVGRPAAVFAHPEDRASLEAGFADLDEHAPQCWKAERRLVRGDGTVVWVETMPSVVRGPDGVPERVAAIVVDVTEQKRSDEMLRASQRQILELLALTEAIQAAAPVASGVIDAEFRIIQANATMAELLGFDRDASLGRPVEEVLPDLYPHFTGRYREVLSTGAAVAALEVVAGPTPAESSFWLTNYYPVRVDGEVAAIGIVGIDVSVTKRAEAFNRAVMETMAEGLYSIDADGRITFVNQAATRMLGWSADELRGCDAHQAMHHQKPDGASYPASECPLLQVLESNAAVRVVDEVFTRKDGSLLPVAYSVAPLCSEGAVYGAVVVFRDVTDEQEQAQQARRALDELSWVGRIRDALDEGRFVLYSQPIESVRGDLPDAEELLIRMVLPNGKTILPAAFLPTAEKYGLIADIDRWVIGQAVTLAAAGRRVEANVSAETVSQPGFLPWVAGVLAASGADPSLLVFELTETALMRNLDVGEDFARALTGMGCHLALDDFGTGFGSFTYLKRLPVSYLKIDQEFVRDLTANADNQHVVRAVVNLAKAFGQRTIAEGVEDPGVLGLLAELGVDYAQGFHVGEPELLRPAAQSSP